MSPKFVSVADARTAVGRFVSLAVDDGTTVNGLVTAVDNAGYGYSLVVRPIGTLPDHVVRVPVSRVLDWTPYAKGA